MAEWLVDARGGICPNCEREYQSLATHWARNQQCTSPELDTRSHQVIRGCLLGDGSLDNPNDGPPALRISSLRYAHLAWIHGQLDWLSRGITRDSEGTYRLRTLSHPALGRYWTWQGNPPVKDWTLTTPVARIWYACDGSLEWPGDSARPRATWTISDDRKRAACRRALTDQGYDPMVWERRLALSLDETAQFLEWLGPPAPGSEYKWALDRSRYRSRRQALDTAAEHGDSD